MRPDARLQAHAVDDVAGVEPADLAVGVELVEVGDAQRQVRVGEELDGLGLGGAQNELRDAPGAVGVHALQLGGVGALGEQAGEAFGRGEGLGVVLRRANHDAAGVQVVVESLALAQELRTEEDLAVAEPLAQARGVADGDGRLDDDPGVRVNRANGGDGGLDGARVEEVPVRVVVGGRGDDGVVGVRIGLGHVDGGVQVELALPRLGLRQEALDLVVLDGRLVVVDLRDLLGHDVQRVHLVVLRKKYGEGQADIAGTGDSDFHGAIICHYFLFFPDRCVSIRRETRSERSSRALTLLLERDPLVRLYWHRTSLTPIQSCPAAKTCNHVAASVVFSCPA